MTPNSVKILCLFIIGFGSITVSHGKIPIFIQNFEAEEVGSRGVTGFTNSGSEASYAAKVVSREEGEPVRNGKHSYRFETRFMGDARPVDKCVRIRSELSESYLVPWREEIWYSYSIYIPEGYQHSVTDTRYVECLGAEQTFWSPIVGQFHRKPDECDGSGNPWLVCRMNKNTFAWSARATAEKCTPTGDRIDIGAKDIEFPTDTWIDVKMQLRFDWEEDGVGLCRVWMDVGKGMQQLVDYQGPIAYNDEKGGYFKIGIYAVQPDPFAHKIVYLDEFRRGPTEASVRLPEKQ